MVSWLPIAFWWSLIATSGVLLFTTRQRLGRRPHCRRCNYDVSIQLANQQPCPECGGGLQRRGAVRLGRRTVFWWRAALAGCLLLVAMLPALVGLIGNKWNVLPYLPAHVLRGGFRLVELRTAGRMYAELVRRNIAGELADAILLDASIDFIAAHPDGQVNISFPDLMDSDGTSAQWERLLQLAIDDTRLVTRASATRGLPRVFGVRTNRPPPRGCMTARSVQEVRFGQQRVRRLTLVGQELSDRPMEVYRSDTLDAVGQVDVEVDLELTVGLSGQINARRTITLTAPVQVIACEPVVAQTCQPKAEAHLLEHFQMQRLRRQTYGGFDPLHSAPTLVTAFSHTYPGQAGWDYDPNRARVAFETFIDFGHGMRRWSQADFRSEQTTDGRRYVLQGNRRRPGWLEGEGVEVLLVPSARRARQAPQLLPVWAHALWFRFDDPNDALPVCRESLPPEVYRQMIPADPNRTLVPGKPTP